MPSASLRVRVRRSDRTACRTRALLLVGCIALAPWSAPAQIVDVESVEGALQVGADFRRERFTSEGRPTRRFERNRFEEELDLSLSGSVVAPQVLRYRLGGAVGLRQEQLDSSDADLGGARGFLLGYDALMNVLPRLPLSLDLFANRFQDTFDQSFGTENEILSEAFGTTLRSSFGEVPAELTWQSLRSISESRGTVTNRRDETRRLIELNGRHLSETLQARLHLRDEDVDDESLPPVGDYHVREAGAFGGYLFGPYLEKSLRLGARWFERTGNFDFENLNASSDFLWEVTETFASELRYDFNRFRGFDQSTLSHDGSLGFRHQLYESLWTNLSFFGDRLERGSGERLAYGSDLSLSYRKQLPLDSRLLIDLAGRYRIEDRDFEEGLDFVTGERLLLEDLTDNFLENPRADPSTVQVFESLDRAPLQEGLDYTLDVIGDRVSIDVLPGGILEPGDEVLVRYQFRTDPAVKLRRTGFGFGVGWDLGWLEIGYEHDEAAERALEGPEPASLQDSVRDILRLGLEGRWRALRGAAAVSYTDESTSSIDYTELAFRQQLTWRPARAFRVGVHLRQARRDFARPERETRTLQAGSSVGWTPRRGWTVTVFQDFRRLEDSTSPDQETLETGLRGDLRFGRIQLVPTFSFTRRELGSSVAGILHGGIRLRRTF